MAHALEEAWTVLKYDYKGDYFDDDEDWNIMDTTEDCPCEEGLLYTHCQCPAACDNCDCKLLQHDETPTIGRELRPHPEEEEQGRESDDLAGTGQEESVREQWGDELQELRSEGHNRDYSHLDPNQAAWHQEMDRRAKGIPEGLKNYLAEIYERWKRAFEEGNTQIMRDADELMNQQGGRLRIGELLGDEEAIDELKQYDSGAADREMGILSADDFGQVGVVDDRDAPADDPDDEEPLTRKKRSQIDRLLAEGPHFIESKRAREKGEDGRWGGYVRTNKRHKSSGISGRQSGGEDKIRDKQRGRDLGHKKQSTMDRARPHHTAFLTASRLAARLHANRANREGGWAYHPPETHPDFAEELPPSRSVLVQRPSGERTALPAGTYEKPHPELNVGEEEE